MATQTVIQRVRQGAMVNLPALLPGEFGYAKDTKRLFIGNDVISRNGNATDVDYNFGIDLDNLGATYKLYVDDVLQQEGTDYLVNNYIVRFTTPPSLGTDNIRLLFNSEIILSQPPEGILDTPKTFKLTETAAGTYSFYPIVVDAGKYSDLQIRYSITNNSDKRRKGTIDVALDSSTNTFTINDEYTTNDVSSLRYAFNGTFVDGIFTLTYTLNDPEIEESTITWIEEHFYAPDFDPDGTEPDVPALALQPYRYTLGGLVDVNVTGASDGQLLSFDLTAGEWVPVDPGGSPYDQSLNIADDVEFNSVTTNNLIITGSGTTTISSGANIDFDATDRVSVTDTPFRLANMDTTARDALTAFNGDMIYNTDTNKLQAYANGTWVDLH